MFPPCPALNLPYCHIPLPRSAWRHLSRPALDLTTEAVMVGRPIAKNRLISPLRYYTLLACLCLSLLLAGCGSGAGSVRNQEPGRNALVPNDTPIVEVPARWASANARDVQTLVQTTDAVFVGEVTALTGQREERLGIIESESTGSNPPRKPATRRPVDFPISVYEVLIQRSLAGAPAEGSDVVLEQPGGLITRADGSQARVILEGDEMLEAGRTYLFFASVKDDGVVTSAPFARFVVSDDGSLAPLKSWADLPAAQRLASLSVDEASIEVQAAGR